MIWAKEETMSRAEIEAVQLARLKEAVTRNYERVPAYRAKMEAAGVKDIRTKCLRSNTAVNVVAATFEGLKALRTPEEVARTRGKSVDEIVG